MQLADIGVNLADKRFAGDLDEVLARAQQAGIAAQVITGTSLASSQRAIALCEQYPGLWCTAGLHPHQASDFNAALLDDLRQLCAHPAVRAVGETGLDFNRDFSPRPRQENAFARQLALASEVGLPAFLHQRDAHERFMAILREHRDQLRDVVVHCFTDDRRALFDYLDLDCHIGITGWICDPRRGTALQNIVSNIPLDRLMIETDSPYLLPRNMDGKPPRSGRNEPALLIWVARQVASCYQCDVDAIAAATWENSRRFLSLDEPEQNQS